MKEIYGYKEKDVIGLAEFLQNRKGGTLTRAFSEYSKLSGKAQGTVRNLYYALAKKSKQDKGFSARYLSGKTIDVCTAVAFTEQEEKDLITKILVEKSKGKSVRATIMELANGDLKLALRYQNKYRNAVKLKPELIREIVSSIGKETFSSQENRLSECDKESVKKLKSEINKLVERIGEQVRKENQQLKIEIFRLQKQNQNLREQLNNKPMDNKTIKYFIKSQHSIKG